MKKIIAPTIVVLIGLAVSYGFMVGKPAPKKKVIEDVKVSSYEVIDVEPALDNISIVVYGTVKTSRQLDLVSQLNGEILEVNKELHVGAEFAKGAVLAKIDPGAYEVARAKAVANLAAAKERLANERGLARQAKTQWRDLGNKEANELFLRRPQLLSAEENLKAAEEEHRQALRELDKTNIAMPFDGIVKSTSVEKGQYISATGAIATVFDSKNFEVELLLTDHQLALLGAVDLEGSTAQVILEGVYRGQPQQWLGSVVSIARSVNANTRQVPVLVSVQSPNAEGVAMIDALFVTAAISGQQVANVVRIPSSALVGKSKVWQVLTDNSLSSLDVKFLRFIDDDILVSTGISTPLRLVIRPNTGLRQGTSINPIPRKLEVR